MVRVTPPSGKSPSPTSRDEEPEVPPRVPELATYWVQIANDLLWRTQRKLAAMALRDL